MSHDRVLAMAEDTTTIQLKVDTWEELNARKQPGMSFDDVIRELLDAED